FAPLDRRAVRLRRLGQRRARARHRREWVVGLVVARLGARLLLQLPPLRLEQALQLLLRFDGLGFVDADARAPAADEKLAPLPPLDRRAVRLRRLGQRRARARHRREWVVGLVVARLGARLLLQLPPLRLEQALQLLLRFDGLGFVDADARAHADDEELAQLRA